MTDKKKLTTTGGATFQAMVARPWAFASQARGSGRSCVTAAGAGAAGTAIDAKGNVVMSHSKKVPATSIPFADSVRPRPECAWYLQ